MDNPHADTAGGKPRTLRVHEIPPDRSMTPEELALHQADFQRLWGRGRPAVGGRIPDSYALAAWRNILPPDPTTGRVGIGFDLAAGGLVSDLAPGGVVRLQLTANDARKLAETLAEYLGREG
jgi:hypothetical protein